MKNHGSSPEEERNSACTRPLAQWVLVRNTDGSVVHLRSKHGDRWFFISVDVYGFVVKNCRCIFGKKQIYRLNWAVLWVSSMASSCIIIKRSSSIYHWSHRSGESYLWITTVFVDTRLWKTKHPWKRFQKFRQSCVLLRDRIDINQLQPLVWPSNLLYVMLSGCDWWISIRSVNNKQDWRKFWKRFRGCFVFQSRVSTKTVGSTSRLPGI